MQGKAQIEAWNDRENMGTHNRIAVTGVRPNGEGIVLGIEVRGDGYNDSGTFAIRSRDGGIRSMVIRG